MAGAKGYSSYRGKNPKWKPVLAVLLVLVILAAAVVMLLQRHIVYDETGTPRLEIPWQRDEREQPSVETPADDELQLDLVIQEPEPEQPEIRAFTVTETPLTMAALEAARIQMAETCNAATVILKDSSGHLRYDSTAAVQWAREIESDTTAALTELLQGETAVEYAVARFSCFHDPRAANADTDGMGLKNTGGYIFYDGNNSQWIDPAKPAARAYLCGLAEEIAALGFDELLLTDVSYPTEGKLDKIAYGETTKNENLRIFLTELRAALEPYEILVSLEVPAVVITAGQDEAAGLVLSEIAPLVDRIYAPAAPEEIEDLSAAVAAASASTGFVPILTSPAEEGSWLLA